MLCQPSDPSSSATCLLRVNRQIPHGGSQGGNDDDYDTYPLFLIPIISVQKYALSGEGGFLLDIMSIFHLFMLFLFKALCFVTCSNEFSLAGF